MAETELPFACDLTAIAKDQRGAHLVAVAKIFQAVGNVRELPNGYTFSLSNESEILLRVAQFIGLERLCCPFFDFRLEVEREGGPVWLSITGSEGVKPFIIAEIVNHLPANVLLENGAPA